MQAAQESEEGGLSSALDTPHTPVQPHQAQLIFTAGPELLWVCHSELRVGLSTAASTAHRAMVPPATQGRVAPRVGIWQSWA